MKWFRIASVISLEGIILFFGAQWLSNSRAASIVALAEQSPQVGYNVSQISPDTGSAGAQSGLKAKDGSSGIQPDAGASQTEMTCGGVYTATADTFVRETQPTTNFENASLRVSQGSGNGIERILLKFDPYGAVPEGGLVQSAELELNLYQDPAPATYTLQVYSHQNPLWVETEVTWNNQPAPDVGFGPVSYGITYTLPVSSVVRLDVTTWATLWATGGITHTGLTIEPAGAQAMSVSFYDRGANGGHFAPRLVIHCAPPKTVVPQDSMPGDALQLAGLERLKLASTITPTFQMNGPSLRFAEFQVEVPAIVSDTGTARALWFTRVYSDALRLTYPDSLQLLRRSEDDQHIFFRQLHKSIPVYPSEIGVHLSGDQVVAVNEGIIPEITLDPNPQISAERAEAIALALAGEGVELIGSTQLTYLNLGLTGGQDNTTYLAWRVNLSTNAPAFIDANSGKLLYELAQDDDSYRLDLHSREWLDEIGCPTLLEISTHFCDEHGCESKCRRRRQGGIQPDAVDLELVENNLWAGFL